MPDIAQLSIEINADSVTAATAKMDTMAASGTKLQGSLGEVEGGTAKLIAQQDRFLQELDKQAATLGKGSTALRAYKAEQLGLEDDPIYQRLAAQVSQAEAAMNQVPSTFESVASRMEGRAGTMVLRMGVHFALVTAAIGGISWVFDEAVNGTQKWMDLGNKLVDQSAKQALSAANILKSMREESAAYDSSSQTVSSHNAMLERQEVLRSELMALGPQYRNAIGLENASLEDQVKILRSIQELELSKINRQISAASQNKPSPSVATKTGIGILTNPIFGGLGSMVLNAGLRDDIENINKYDEGLNKLYKDKSEIERALATLDGAYDKKTTTTTTVERTTEYGREVERLQEELLKLTVSEREAFEMKLKLMDNGKSGNVDEALGLYDQIEAYKKWVAEQKTAQQEGANLQNTLMGLKDAYDKVALSDAELLAIQLRDQGADEEAVQNALDLTAATKALNDQKQAEKRINDEVARLNTKDDYATRMAHVQDLLNHGLNTESYHKEMHKLLLESQTLWGDTAYVIENSADRSSEALANFFNGTKTGFRSMVSDMLIEIEKLYIKQKLVQPLFQWLTSVDWSRMFGGGGDDPGFADGYTSGGVWRRRATGGPVDGGGAYLVGEVGPELFVPHSSGTIVPNNALGGQTINSTSVTVHVHQDGSSTSQVSSSQGADLGKLLSGKVQDEIRKQMQPGGLLNRKN